MWLKMISLKTLIKVISFLAVICITSFASASTMFISDDELSYNKIMEYTLSNNEVILKSTKYNVEISNKAKHLTLPKLKMPNNKKTLGQFMEFLNCFPNLTKVDMYDTVVSREHMKTLFDTYPQITFGWTIYFGKKEVRTDITAYSSKHSMNSKRFREGYYEVLRYCKNLEALDLGHNQIGDISFISNLKKLKVLILADNDIVDISPIENLENLEYLEVFKNRIKDVSPLEKNTKLKDFNASYNRIKDVTPLLKLKNIERIWLSHNGISKDVKETLINSLPNVQIDFDVYNPTDGGWREHERYFEVINYFK